MTKEEYKKACVLESRISSRLAVLREQLSHEPATKIEKVEDWLSVIENRRKRLLSSLAEFADEMELIVRAGRDSIDGPAVPAKNMPALLCSYIRGLEETVHELFEDERWADQRQLAKSREAGRPPDDETLMLAEAVPFAQAGLALDEAAARRFCVECAYPGRTKEFRKARTGNLKSLLERTANGTARGGTPLRQ